MQRARIAVIGHVEHVTLGRIDGVPHAGDVIHLQKPRFLPGGGGAIAFAQLCRSNAEIHFFTAIGDDAAGAEVRARLSGVRAGVHVHAASRKAPHPRVVVVVDENAHRTIVVTGAPLQAAAQDDLPWSVLAECDAVYFTGDDPEALKLARAAKHLVVTARRRPTIDIAKIPIDVIVGSTSDPRENAAFGAYDPAPGALVLTDGDKAIKVISAARTIAVTPKPLTIKPVGDYGAGDSFAGALTYFLATGAELQAACATAADFGAAVLKGIDPLESQADLPNLTLSKI